MRLNLPVPGNTNQRLLFSNNGMEDENSFYLLMVFHKSQKGGFDYPATIEECIKALKRKNKNYYYKMIQEVK